jgi:metal transporter CNNM
MGSDDLNLRVLAASSDDPKERADAHKVLRLLNRGRHWVLVVLLLANVVRIQRDLSVSAYRVP